MIEISPKALRFARLAAEQQSAFSSDPQILTIKQKEETFRRKESADRLRQYVQISEETADFCIRAVTALLKVPSRFESSAWDGNDFAFMQGVTRSLSEQLIQSNAQVR